MPTRRASAGYATERVFSPFVIGMGLLLALCWMLGGVTVDESPADELLQLAALPMLAWAAWRLASRPLSMTIGLALVLLILVVALPAWQLLPVPHAFGAWGQGRHAILNDLATAGLPGTGLHVSLSLLATERALWSLMPASALFLGALTLPRLGARRLMQALLALILASAAFAFFQLSLRDGSSALLYTSWGRNFGGVFVNPNHQGNALAMGGVIAAAMFIEGRRRAREDGGYRFWLYAAVCAACVAMVPLANGSAAMLLVLVGLVAVAVMLGALDWKAMRRGSRTTTLRVAAAMVLTMIVLASAVAWQHVDANRKVFATTTLQVGEQFSPLGTGVGTFVPIYAQYQDLKQARTETINHAHDEYVQWWLEAGVPAMLVLSIGLGVFSWMGWQVLARMPASALRTVGAGSWVCLLLLLLHSVVDFPMRTTTLMASAGLLAGLLFNVVNASKRDNREGDDRDGATQRA